MNNTEKLKAIKEALLQQRQEIIEDLNSSKKSFSNTMIRNMKIEDINKKTDLLCDEHNIDRDKILKLGELNERTLLLIDEKLRA